MKKYFWIIPVALIVFVGLFLRVYNIGSNYFFEGELGKELLYLRQFSISHSIPLVGLPTSHEFLFYGPVYYWIMLPLFNLFRGSPIVLFWAALAVSGIGLVINYLVIDKLAGRRLAILSTLIQAITPMLVWQTRNSKLHVFFFILIPIFMYLTSLVWNGKKKWLFWAGIVYGLMFSFHLSQIPLLGMYVLLFWLKKNIYKWKDYLKFCLGILIPNITYFWQDWKIFAWVPYRTLNIADKNPGGTVQALTEYFGRNIFWNNTLWIVGLLLFIVIFAHYVYTNRHKFTKEFLPFYLISSIGITVIANIIHGAPPIHYFLPIYTIVPILYAIYLAKYKWSIILLMLIVGVNFSGYFTFAKPDIFVPISKQEAIADFIIHDSKGMSFSIKRIGPYDYFPENYSQNYKYLILWKGGNLDNNSKNTYTINETLGTVSK